MKTKQDRFFREFFKSIRNFDSYKEISENKLSRTFKYFAILMLLYAIVMTIGITHEIYKFLSDTQNFINNEINLIEYTDGELNVNNNERKTYYDGYVIIDTSVEDTNNFDGKICFGKKGCVISVNERKLNLRYEDFIEQNVNKQTVLDLFEFKKYACMIICMTIILSYITISISTLTDILIISIIGLIISAVVGNNKLKFSNNFNIGVHSITLPVVLSMIYFIINNYTGFEIKYFSVMYSSIAIIYQITAILLINMEKNKSNTNC